MGREAKGSVRYVNGKWLARLRGEHLGSFDTEQEAWDLIELTLRMQAGREPDTLQVFGSKWLDDRELGGDIRGIDKERSVWRQHCVTAPFASWPLRRIRPTDAQQWLNAVSKKKKVITTRTKKGVKKRASDKRVAQQTVKHARRVMSGCFRAAVIAGKITSNPLDHIITPKMATVTEDEDAWTFLSVEEIARLFAALAKARRHRFYTAWYAVAIYGGLRLEEIKGLRWEDVRNGELRIRRSSRGALKEKSSRRNVPQLRPLREALAAWQREGGVVKSHGLVFPSDHGAKNAVKTRRGSYYSDGYDAAWETQWRSKAGCRPSVRFHDLRHTCGSHLVIGSWGHAFELIEVRDWLGHADIQTTQRYAHLAPGSLRSKVSELEAKRESKGNARLYGHGPRLDSDRDSD